MFTKLLAVALCVTSLSSCAGYKLGNSKPTELKAVHTIAVPLFKNETQEQRLATLTTNSMVDAINRDGTYRIGTSNTADATLQGTISTVRYSERRSNRFDSLKASEMYMYLEVKWTLVDAQGSVLASGKDSGRSQFSVDLNQQTSHNNAFPDAAKNTAELVIQSIANGF